MNLFKTSVLNGIAVLIKTATMFILNKILAIYVGPSGYAAIGQFQNFIQLITSFAGGAVNTSVVKYTAEYYENPEQQKTIWKTAGTTVLIFSFIASFLILFFKKPLAIYIFKSIEYQSIFVWFATFLVFFNFNALFLAILNGKKEILRLVIANIAGSIISLAVTALLAVNLNLYGALIALSINQSIVFFVTLILCYRSDWFSIKYLIGPVDPQTLRKISKFALMSITTVLFGNIAQILLRNFIIDEFDIVHAGYWDAMTRLSGGYLMFASTLLGIYYLPKLSELKEYHNIKKEVRNGYLYILPVAVLCSFMIYIFQDLVINTLFTKDFTPMKELISWQLIGDVIKIGSWIISYMMLSKAMTKIFVMTEAFFALSIIPVTMLMTYYYDFKGIAIAFALNSLLYWIVCSYLSFRKLKVM